MAAPERVDAVAWALLTLHAHIDMHVKRFKASFLRTLGPFMAGLACTSHAIQLQLCDILAMIALIGFCAQLLLS